jgi:endoglucanase
MGACGCGTGNTDPFSWQWTQLTAAGSAPIYGSGTWCGSGCGKCYRLTPTAVGASPDGTGATTTTSVIAKVTNLCPYTGNEQWCAYDVNSYGYDAHFDLMDYNMAGLVSAMGWNNPEVTYEEVDCASNGYLNWGCECASNGTTAASTSPVATAAPIQVAPTTPPSKGTTTTGAPSTSTTTTTQAPATTASSVQIQVNGGSNAWWIGLSVVGTNDISKVEVMDSGSVKTWTTMSYQGDSNWNMYSYQATQQLVTPISLRFTSASGQVSIASNIITSFQAIVVDTNLIL